MHIIDLYVDGSSLIKKGEYESSSAYVLYIDNVCVFKSGKYHPNGTNSLGEVYALSMGLYKIKEIIESDDAYISSKITVYGDSDYVIKSVTSYIKTWVKQGLENTWYSYSTKKEVMYQEIFKSIYKDFLYKGNPYKITFRHINSHISKSGYKKARFAYMKRNNVDITEDEFRLHSSRNDEVDKLAETIRLNKTHYFEEGDLQWVNTNINLLRRNSRVVIRRNIRR